MNRIAEFERVSESQFTAAMVNTFTGFAEADIADAYKLVTIPKRSTSGSAGYDFISPVSFTLKPGESIVIPTGLRCQIDDGWFLMCMPRSGLGFKFEVKLANTVGVIDSDYYNADNEGHIMIKLSNPSKEMCIKGGDRIAQGIFIPYGITRFDNVVDSRKGGFGSTGR